MKKQRILALTLAAATATSMFGGFSASAEATPYTEYDEAYLGAGAKGTPYAATASDITLDGTKSGDEAKVGKIVLDDVADIDSFDSNKIYLFDLNQRKDKAEGANLDKIKDLILTIQENVQSGDTNYAALKTEMDKYFGATQSATAGTYPYELSSDVLSTSATRLKAIDDFKDALEDSKKFGIDKNGMIDKTNTMYDVDELLSLGLGTLTDDTSFDYRDADKTLIDDMNDLQIATAATSTLVYYVNEYNRVNDMISPVTSWEDKYNVAREKADLLVEEDYGASEWSDVQNLIRKAEIQAEKGTDAGYKAAVDLLDDIASIKTLKPDWSALKTAIESLFGTVPSDAVTSTTTADKIVSYPLKGASTATYNSDHYDDKDLWKEFDKAYREAKLVYEKCKKATLIKYVAQSTVNSVVENLDNAILAMDPNYETADWVIVRLQGSLDKANAVVEDDYRTTSSLWKDFVAKRNTVEKMLAAPAVQSETASDAADKLDKAVEALVGCRKAIPSDIKNALAASIKEGEKLLKDKTDKTAVQLIALEDALDAAKKMSTLKNTISQYEKALADLDAAIAGYKHPQGWYQKDGKWFYGKDDKDLTGWIVDNGKDYYLNADGSMATGWVKSERGYWYWMDATKGGAMTKNAWVKVNNGYYFLQANGIMKTGWINDNGTWYYANPSSGAIVYNGWYQINGKHYYFYANGAMAANTTINGYKVDASGAWVK